MAGLFFDPYKIPQSCCTLFLASLLLFGQQLPASSRPPLLPAELGTCAFTYGGISKLDTCVWNEKSYGVVRLFKSVNKVNNTQLTELVKDAMFSSDVKRLTDIDTRISEVQSALCLHLGHLDEEKRAALADSVRSLASPGSGVVFSETESCIKARQGYENKDGPYCKANLPSCYPNLSSYCNVNSLSPFCAK